MGPVVLTPWLEPSGSFPRTEVEMEAVLPTLGVADASEEDPRSHQAIGQTILVCQLAGSGSTFGSDR